MAERGDRSSPVEVAGVLVATRFPDARAAWLGGSVVEGRGTPTSDLDITVLLPDGAEVRRESLHHDGWPVELFVHDDASVRHFVEKDRARRRPTMARLVGEGRPLAGAADELVAHCRAVLAAGPPRLSDAEVDLRRYQLTDLLDDLAGGGPPTEQAAVAVATWVAASELLLAVHDRWWGTGKWLVREVAAHDAASGSAYAERLHAGLVGHGTDRRLVEVSEEVLDLAGGPLWAGYVAEAALPPRRGHPG